ncbi:hypothetical protein WMY93_006798 [Mugilogobius chulae]|uniref:Uncharacterized protein n=1 Tax=Mugilogobius chulae TaxID=88201 RepID=A0AAW0PS72_9GOBI
MSENTVFCEAYVTEAALVLAAPVSAVLYLRFTGAVGLKPAPNTAPEQPRHEQSPPHAAHRAPGPGEEAPSAAASRRTVPGERNAHAPGTNSGENNPGEALERVTGTLRGDTGGQTQEPAPNTRTHPQNRRHSRGSSEQQRRRRRRFYRRSSAVSSAPDGPPGKCTEAGEQTRILI